MVKALREIDTNFERYQTESERMRDVRTTQSQVQALTALYQEVLSQEVLPRDVLSQVALP